ncbi:MAG: 50S ribosomal protein L24 [Caldilineaceae bacterium]|nr:50S ribosomal protein L24 [Caldilineaceae bacterium]MBP8109068.1 50S ribosomal protein L24 [Caldilineaceae bacterium]MBP8122051.1 50S ribosomal protein L24 [Caldilineaceae bacterium]
MKLKINKGDTVEIIAGEYKGHRGQVQRVIRKKFKNGTYDPNNVYIIVTGANLVIRHQKATGGVQTQTGRIEKEAPLHISNAMLLGTDGKTTRAGFEGEGVDKERIDRRSGDPLPRPRR